MCPNPTMKSTTGLTAIRDPEEPRPVKHGFWVRVLTLLIFKSATHKFLGRLWKSPQCRGVIFFSRFCIKASPSTTLAEASAMRFVSRHTFIPVPKVYCAFRYKDRTYIVMERIDGQMVGRGWKLRSEKSRTRILNQLRTIAQELRDIHPPERGGIGVTNVDGGPICDCRLSQQSFWGPFKSIDDFHKELRAGADTEALENLPSDLQELMSFHKRPWPSSVFTHGDLSSLNILARGDKVVGLVDWETAGWFPPYWEYVCAWNVNPQNEFWREEVDKFLPPMPHDLEMERVRRKYFGDF
ncbi:kinase-like domain-containing protein [Zalerion maritima]|uniref:Kinase-like domain-containing protein n=1 Tax=Zalerion maritima TaxID=339359 RepID=A0AAD5RFQ0_9PEZI|nr:kinase-like domain-containing protein [Zalerion maritima]